MDKEDAPSFGEGRTLAASPGLPWALLAAACLGSFATSSSGTTRAPFLLEMARDLDVSMPWVANLVSLTATAWGITSAAGGMLSHLIGRRILLVAGLLALSVAMALQAFAGNFVAVAGWATAAGGSCGIFTGVIFAEVSARVADRQRGRALGWVMSGQSLALVVGVPLAAWIGSLIGWRGWNVCVAGLAMVAGLCLAFALGRTSPIDRATARPSHIAAALSWRVLALLGTGVAERVCYGLAAIYFATFLQEVYGLSLAALALPLAVFALGNVAGTILGGQIADRRRDRLATFAVAMLFSAAASAGWIGAAALGAVMVTTVGFEGFGPLAALLGCAGAGGALLCRRFTRT